MQHIASVIHGNHSLSKKEIGKKGEDIARQFLVGKGYCILESNTRVGAHDEVDLIAYDPFDDVLVFVEVKTRTQHSTDYHPELNITPAKRACMSRAARQWIAEHEWEGGYRLDVIAIADGNVTAHHAEIEWE